ncbi:hypothetical protein [Acidithiobacillus sulfuriphilus]|uniref:Uncharacterized protein n=2 Tax=Acidithiobacillus sulfuriphilus TaxID=1867749 RepID=A0A3M8QU38_9PROT|nr:hypothetical protein [Acidithiobacillus sulfuriphilus]RNF59803.1 hypothetical protein EC580_10300 [Acidithiobacillus sulfuriphilus]
MTNVYPFPKSPKGKAVKLNRKDPGPAGGGPAGGSPAFRLRDHNGDPVDVLMAVIQAGGMYLIPTPERPVDDLPTTHLLRTIDGLNALTDAANVLVYHAMRHPAEFPQEDADTLVRQGKQAHKMMHKLDEMLPSDDFIMTMDSYGPDVMAEYATNAAIIIASTFALDVMVYYDKSFIRTGKDKRKAMFRDFQGAYRAARDECLSRSEGHEFLIKELTSAHRAMQKVLKAL